MLITCSWDDGHPLDLRVAALMARHGLRATFYCPITNREGLPVMDKAQLRELASAGFEIGGHTHDHVYADTVRPGEWTAQILSGKSALEDRLGTAVSGFCFPGGRRLRDDATRLAQAGFRYARTTENLRLDSGNDPWAMPTTLQCYPHRPAVLWRNFVRRGRWASRARPLRSMLTGDDLPAQVRGLVACARRTGPQALIHLWGHSWEIEHTGLWPQLEECLSILAAATCPEDRLTNYGVWQRLMAAPKHSTPTTAP